MTTPVTDRLIGLLLIGTTLVVAVSEWHGGRLLAQVAPLLVVIVLGLLAIQVQWTRRIFVLVGLLLVMDAKLTRPDWLEMTESALKSAAFIAAFFTALATLRNASASSPAIQTCGRFLAQQPPGRRYAALTIGGQLFGMLLNYGSIVLLGGLAEANARLEPNAEIRNHRIRRMLLAIQRGFVSTLPWSPLAFAMAVSIALVPGASWADAVGPCFVSGLILAGLGWALDTIFKPRLTVAVPPRPATEATWFSLWPLVLLLGLLILVVGGLHLATGVRAVGVVMGVVPLLSLGWVALQSLGHRPLVTTARRAAAYVTEDLPEYRSEILLLMMAGFIGTLGARLAVPLVAASGLDLAAIPGWQILVVIVWLIPLAGQIGMNPILTVSFLAPILPDAAALGLSPTDIIVAITAGWALSGASSPFTATTLLIGSIGNVSARHVGLRWNGAYTLVSGAVLTVWVVIVALI